MMSSKRALSLLLLAIVTFGASAGQAVAEVKEVNIGSAMSTAFLPLMIITHEQLLEKHAKADGLGDIKVNYRPFATGAVMKDAVVGGSLEIASGGVPPFLQLWDKTKGNLDVRAIAGMSLMPLYLNTRNPAIKSIKDFTEKDKIGVTTVKSAIQAILIQMYAAKEWGYENYDKLDKLTIGLPLADQLTALLSGQSEITGDFTVPPFHYKEKETPGIHTVTSSIEILGGPATYNLIYTTQKFYDANPKTYKAFYAAYKDALKLIEQDKNKAAQIYIKVSGMKFTIKDIARELEDPEQGYSIAPKSVMKFADFMLRVGTIKNKPNSWKDLFFPGEVHGTEGS